MITWLTDDGINFDIANADANDIVEMLYLLMQNETILSHACSKVSEEDAEKIRSTFEILSSEGNKTVVEPIHLSKPS